MVLSHFCLITWSHTLDILNVMQEPADQKNAFPVTGYLHILQSVPIVCLFYRYFEKDSASIHNYTYV